METKTNMPELLAPARDRGAFLAALAAGADAIYCGVSGTLNARRKAAGIGFEELGALCSLAHRNGARVYVTANVAVREDELDRAVTDLARLSAAGADAAIIQDWGLLAEVRRCLPELEVHVSTQANVHDARGVALCREIGASRVTLSRELSVDEIAQIHAEVPEVELEVFAHGSLCVCYSGLCMLSSYLREGRSPNRGLCAQPCRLPFDLLGEEGRVISAPGRERGLCMADSCAIDLVGELARAGVASLKVEGRMKAAAYVHAVVSAWRGEINAVLGGGETSGATGAGRRQALRRSFNRGFTDAYLRGETHTVTSDDMMSYERSTNRGELVGEVVGFEGDADFRPRDGKPQPGFVSLRLSAAVGAGDALELRHPDEPTRFLVCHATEDAEAGSTIRCHVPREVPAGADVRLTSSRALVDAAHEAIEELEAELAGLFRSYTPSKEPGNVRKSPASDRQQSTSVEICALATSPDQARALREAGASRVYLDVNELAGTPLAAPDARFVDEILRAGIVPVLDEVCHECDHDRLDAWVREGGTVAVGSVSELALARERGTQAEVRTCIPVHNLAAARTLRELGASGIWLSPELSLEELRRLVPELEMPAGLIAFGRPRLMTCERCVLQVAGDCGHECPPCARRHRALTLRNIDDRRLPVHTDPRGRSRVYDDEIVDLTPLAHELVGIGIRRLLVDARALTDDEALDGIRRLRTALDAPGAPDAATPGAATPGAAPSAPLPDPLPGLLPHGVA